MVGVSTLHRLHQVVQAVMGWQDYHLYAFHIGSQTYGDPQYDDEGTFLDTHQAQLCDVLGHRGSACGYLYDFGDTWQHVLFLESIFVPHGEVFPRCTASARACPPEDVGGARGFVELLKALSDRRHPEHDSYRTWAGDVYDPALLDIERIIRAVRRFQPRRSNVDAAGLTV